MSIHFTVGKPIMIRCGVISSNMTVFSRSFAARLAVGAQVFIAHDDVAHAEDGVVQHGEKLVVRIAQLLAAQTHGVAVDHVRRGEVGHHPAVAQHGLDHQDRVAAELCGHEAVEIEPAEEIIKRVPEAAPFAGAEGAVRRRNRSGRGPCRFWGCRPCQLSSFCAARSCFISRLSTKACTRVRS